MRGGEALRNQEQGFQQEQHMLMAQELQKVESLRLGFGNHLRQ